MADETQKEEALEGGSYEILRQRILSLDAAFTDKLKTLNDRRRDIFGSTELKLVAEDRIMTANNGVPRDITNVGDHLVFGYNVFIGLRSAMTVNDVLSVHKFNGTSFEQSSLPAFEDKQFLRDFQDLYRYYKKACFLQFIKANGHLLMIFQSGETVNDVMVFRFAIANDGTLSYIDNRGDQEYSLPPQHSFEWTSTTRENQVAGKHPHINIDNVLFVECIEGDLTIKVENNTDTGTGIYSEPVENKDQALDDASIQYACVEGLYLLRIRPFGENEWRYFVFNPRFTTVCRIDSIAQACVLLPEGQGFIFPKGCYQQNGAIREFDADTEGMQFLECVRSPNGEDFMYIFYNTLQGRHIIFTYNLISKEIAAPVICHGYSIFDDGRMVIFSDPDGEARRNHPMQVWQTPFFSDSFSAPVKNGGYLSMVGNRSLVRGISEGYGISRLIHSEPVTISVYQQIIRDARKMLDAYHWLSSQDCLSIADDVNAIRSTAISAVGEYEKYLAIKQDHENRLKKHEETIAALRTEAATTSDSADLDVHVRQLESLRACRGASITLQGLKFIDQTRLEECNKSVDELTALVSDHCINLLLSENGLNSYIDALDSIEAKLPTLKLLEECHELQKALDDDASKLDLLTATVNNLSIKDARKSAEIIERITNLFANVNRLRSAAKNKTREIGIAEARIDFASQFKLLSQSVSNHIAIADTQEKCDELLTSALVTIEELEGKFSDYDDFLEQLAAKREEIVAAFNTKKQQLNQSRQRRAQHLGTTATRILKGIQSRASSMNDADSLNACFVSDGMALKFNDCIREIRELGDSILADDLEGQLQIARDEALRRQRDKDEIFEQGGNAAILGGRRFHVNSQPFDITTTVKDGRLFAHITATDFDEPVQDAKLSEFIEFYDQELPSESTEVSRGEYLAYDIFRSAQLGTSHDSMEAMEQDAASEEKDGTLLAEIVAREVSTRYDEGYERGVHDHDAKTILRALLLSYKSCGLLRFAPEARAWAMLAFAFHDDRALIDEWCARIASYAERGSIFNDSALDEAMLDELAALLQKFRDDSRLGIDNAFLRQAAEFLFCALKSAKPQFPILPESLSRLKAFRRELHLKNAEDGFQKTLAALPLPARLPLAFSWAKAFLATQDVHDDSCAWEITAFIATDIKPVEIKGAVSLRAEGLRESHRNIVEGRLECRLDEFLTRLEEFRHSRLPRFNAYRQARNAFIDRRRKELRIDEFRAKTMGGFVRNRLINEVYLKIVGDNFAKQMGAAEKGRRTDQMGLLLLISPPGYGKTTLMEYVAATLGLAFMRINGPSIGNRVLSLDPQEAPNATSRLELEKLNLALAMGSNVMLYLDDIQHLSPEFLQKFISLCDAQRKIEGVYGGETRTFDLRGKKMVVVMAGNPYTESGAAFKVPDMLANRADTYNLGDISTTHADAFALSFLENAVTSNRTLTEWNKQWGDSDDLENFVAAAKRGTVEGISFKHSYSPGDLEDMIKTVKYLCIVRDAVLLINKQYIASAAQQDEYRTEPPFKLQGSYRNMNRMAEKIFHVMTEEEVRQVILDHYQNEAQTLTTGAEHNILKFKELMGWLSKEEALRWNDIKSEFTRRLSLGGVDDSSDMGKVLAQLSAFSASLTQIKSALERGFTLAGESMGKAMAGQEQKLNVDLAPLVGALQNQHLDLEPIADALRNQRIDLKPLEEALKSLKLDFTPLADVLQKQNMDCTPLVEALREQRIDFTPLVKALGSQRMDLAPLVAAINAHQTDFTPLMEAVKTQTEKGSAPSELKAVMPPEYAKAWERQVMLFETLVPIMDNARELNDTLAKLQEWLAKHK
ncbi:MAG: DNA repair ATPase [Victivallales bacterium]|nr:DNA repair ATPase [Victivallales bacterium]